MPALQMELGLGKTRDGGRPYHPTSKTKGLGPSSTAQKGMGALWALSGFADLLNR